MARREYRTEASEVQPTRSIPGAMVDGLVWLYDRSNGRITEHLGKVVAIREPVTLDVEVTDQGVVRKFNNVKPWGADSVTGWGSTGK